MSVADAAERCIRDEAISAPWNRLHVPRIYAPVVQCRPHLLDTGVQTIVELDKCAGRPQQPTKLFAAHEFACGLKQVFQHESGLWPQPDPAGSQTDLTTQWVENEFSKTVDSSAGHPRRV